jgi:VWFA-related protein
LRPIEHYPLATLSIDISFIAVNFKSTGNTVWLPGRVTVEASFAGGNLHTVHRFSDYLGESGNSAGIPVTPPANGEDEYELVARGIALSQAGKVGDAIPVLREALGRDPKMPAAHFNLANALRLLGDMAGAQAEFLETAKLLPDAGIAHNALGFVLAKRGDDAGGAAEFRKSAQLDPKNASVHFNLAQTLEKLGDRAGAKEEYRIASELAPGNDVFKTRYEQFAARALVQGASAEPEATISVNVRQVLVPVIVTDKAGHHVTGLKQADFQVFEEGVEQKISAFGVENAGEGTDSVGVSPAQGSHAATGPRAIAPAATPVRRTYVICIDALHGAVGNLMTVRKSLLKLFESERPGDAQYIVLAIGTSTQIVQNATTDAQKVLRAIESKDFQRIFLASASNSMNQIMTDYRRKLDEVRSACDSGQPECMMKNSLPAESRQIESEEGAHDRAFLNQFQSLLQQLAHAQDRRTVVLISDGFELLPGKQANDLLLTYFPEFRMQAPRPMVRVEGFDTILHLAANNNIPIYTIDSRGLYTESYFDASNPGSGGGMMPGVLNIMNAAATDAGQALSEIAAATGGTTFQNSNDLLSGLQRAFADGRQYYMLAYVPADADADGKFRAISVRLRDS